MKNYLIKIILLVKIFLQSVPLPCLFVMHVWPCFINKLKIYYTFFSTNCDKSKKELVIFQSVTEKEKSLTSQGCN